MNPQSSETKLVKDNKTSTKLVKIEAKTDIRYKDEFYKAGSKLEVDEAAAEDFCKPIEGQYDFTGIRYGKDVQTRKIIRAVRL